MIEETAKRTAAPTQPLPTFLIARKSDGRLSIRELRPGENGPEAVERLRANPAYAHVWIARAYQGATGSAEAS